MFLVDNFKIFLLVGLICAVGVPSADAEKLECYKGELPNREECKTDKGMCVIDKDGNPAGCSENCITTDWNYCCNSIHCNSFDEHNVCKVSKNIKGCPGAVDPPGPDPTDPPTEKPNNNGTKSTASGLVPNYYGGIPVVAAVIPIFFLSLKSFS